MYWLVQKSVDVAKFPKAALTDVYPSLFIINIRMLKVNR